MDGAVSQFDTSPMMVEAGEVSGNELFSRTWSVPRAVRASATRGGYPAMWGDEIKLRCLAARQSARGRDPTCIQPSPGGPRSEGLHRGGAWPWWKNSRTRRSGITHGYEASVGSCPGRGPDGVHRRLPRSAHGSQDFRRSITGETYLDRNSPAAYAATKTLSSSSVKRRGA